MKGDHNFSGKVFFEMSMSLDGFIAGPNWTPELPLGEGGARLHQWIYELASWREQHGLAGGNMNIDSDILEESIRETGAVIMGKGMFISGEKHWGSHPPFQMPVFILTHEGRETEIKAGGTSYIFVNDGIEAALEQAKAVAGNKNIKIAGGANCIQQYLRAGLVDEFQIHLIPVLLGGGIRLYEQLNTDHIELERTRVVESPTVTHLRFNLVKKMKEVLLHDYRN